MLYAMLSMCHPKLVERTAMAKPTLQTQPNLFTYIRHYKTWLEFERIAGQSYSEVEQLTAVLETLEQDS